MSKVSLEIVSWIGGQSIDDKMGTPASFAYSRHIDFRKRSSALSILPKTVKDTGTTVDALPLNMIQVDDDTFYAADEDGNVYSSDGSAWSQLASDINSFQYGMAYVRHMDRLLLACNETISSVTGADNILGTPTIEVDTLAQSQDQAIESTSTTYTSQSSILETDLHRLSWSPRTEPLYSLKFKVNTKGTGTVTATLHDAANNSLGTSAVAAAAMTNGQYAEFVFTTRPRLNVAPSGSEYHVHLTHAGGTSTLFDCGSAGDMETISYKTYAARLVNNSVPHPMIEFLQYICIGNERYLSVWEPITTTPLDTEYLRHRLVFPPGRSVIGLALWGDYLAIATGKWSEISQSLEDGKIYFWSGTSVTYDQVLDVPGGAPQSLFSNSNRLYWDVGGEIQAWSGGDIETLWRFPNSDTEFKGLDGATYVNPYMMAVRQGVLLNAWPNATYDNEIEFGVYGVGQRDRNQPLSAGYSYTISTGTRQHDVVNVANMQLGFLKSFGNNLYLGWADYTDTPIFGIDRVSPDNDPFDEAEWHSLIIDNGRIMKDKQAAEMYVCFEELPANATVTPMYRINRGDWVMGDPATVGETDVRLNINQRYKEIQLGILLTAGAETPIVTGIELIWDTLMEEHD